MKLRETGFTFNGIHSRRDMGLLYAEKDGHRMAPTIDRNTYEISGVSGTLLLDGERWRPFTFEGTLYPAEERKTQTEAQRLLRAVVEWLTVPGRKRLAFDYEPDKFYLAEVDGELSWSLKNWFGGEIAVKFRAQPFAYSLVPDVVAKTLTQEEDELRLFVDTGRPAPLTLVISNTGTATITGVEIGEDIQLSGLTLATGQTLTISMEPPVAADIDGTGALQYAETFNQVQLGKGLNVIPVKLTHGSGAFEAAVRATARGRW